MDDVECLVDREYLPVFYEASQVLGRHHVPFLLGGGLMVSLYGRGRHTKDIDFFVRPSDKFYAMDVLNSAGFFTEETEKAWLLKAEKDGAPVDLIVHSGGMPDIDQECLEHARTIYLGGYPFRGFGPEDLLLRKIYSWLEGRPDWWDAVSIVERSGRDVDWRYFLGRVPDYNPLRALSFLLFARALIRDDRLPWPAVQQFGLGLLMRGEQAPAHRLLPARPAGGAPRPRRERGGATRGRRLRLRPV